MAIVGGILVGSGGSGGTDWSLTQTSTGDFTFKLPSNDGTDSLVITDSDDATVASIDSNGVGTFNDRIDLSTNFRMYATGNGVFGLGSNGGHFFQTGGNTTPMVVGSGMDIGWYSTSYWGLNTLATAANVDVRLARDAAGTLAQRNSTNAQTFNLYSTHTDISNYERLAISGDGTIEHEAAGTGTVQDVSVKLGDAAGAKYFNVKDSGGTNVLRVDSDGSISTFGATASGASSHALGQFCSASGTQAVSFGSTCSAIGQASLATGVQCSALGYASATLGRQADVYLDGQVAIGHIHTTPPNNTASHQVSWVGVNGTTSDATQTELFNTVDGSDRITMYDNTTTGVGSTADSTWAFEVTVVARSDEADGNDSAVYKLEGCISNDEGGNCAIIGSVTKTVIAESAGATAWDATAEADDTNDALVVKVTGEASTNISWFASVRLVELTYA